MPPVVVGLALANANLPRYRTLAREGIRADAIVTSPGCDDGRFTFAFEADGREWTGSGRASRADVECDALVAGLHVPVYYRPGNPSEHVATGDPAALVRQELLIVLGFTLAALIGGMGVVWYERRKRVSD